MSRRRFVEQERRLGAELIAKFRGTASVPIQTLEFPFKKLREEDDKNTERLANSFRKEKGCRDWEIFNHIPAWSRSKILMLRWRGPAFLRNSWRKPATGTSNLTSRPDSV